MRLWVRAGDGDNYNPFDGLHEVADYLAEMGATDLEQSFWYGFISPEYRGHNYLSLFWGDDNAQPIRQLTIHEQKETNRLLHLLAPTYSPMNALGKHEGR